MSQLCGPPSRNRAVTTIATINRIVPVGGHKTDSKWSRSITGNGPKFMPNLVARWATLSGCTLGTMATDPLTAIQVDRLLTSYEQGAIVARPHRSSEVRDENSTVSSI
jgi:hypothetical protein